MHCDSKGFLSTQIHNTHTLKPSRIHKNNNTKQSYMLKLKRNYSLFIYVSLFVSPSLAQPILPLHQWHTSDRYLFVCDFFAVHVWEYCWSWKLCFNKSSSVYGCGGSGDAFALLWEFWFLQHQLDDSGSFHPEPKHRPHPQRMIHMLTNIDRARRCHTHNRPKRKIMKIFLRSLYLIHDTKINTYGN